MDIIETGILLAKIQAFDNRTVADPTIIAWQEILAPHTLADALDAVRNYYRVSSEWIMPSHIVERVRDIENRRLDGFGTDLRLNDAEEREAFESGNWREALRRLHRAAMTGELTPATFKAYMAGDTPLEAFLTWKKIEK